jgi:enoyl-CoA hydratase / 3-hydroxyacyl-CoA dehydrogenase
MGHGIAEVFALGGHTVCIRDIEQRFLDNAREKIQSSLTKLHEKGRLAEDVQGVMGRVTFELDLGRAVADKDIVVEAAPENLGLKKKIFVDLEKLAGKSAMLATNTSSLPITEIASAVSDPSRVVGTHFFNPPVLMKLVEVIKGDKTSPDTLQGAFQLVQALGKKPILVQKDVPGFVVNRILARMMVTSRILVQEGMATVEEVDASLKYGAGLPMGAFELLDYIGLDTHELVEEAMAQRGFTIPPGDLILSKVRAGHLGVKTGSGFYTYTKEQPRAVIPRELVGKIPPSLILSPAVNEAVFLMSSSVATRDDIDLSNVLGLGFPKGVLTFADEWGLDKVLENLEMLKEKTQEKWLEPEQALRQMVAKGLLGVKSGEGFYKHNKA